MQSIYLTEREAAEYLRICYNNIRKLRKSGLPHIRVSPRCIRYTREILDQYIKDNRIK